MWARVINRQTAFIQQKLATVLNKCRLLLVRLCSVYYAKKYK